MIIIGDALTELKGLEEKSINCCVTSPPYFGLRDYGIQPTEWPEIEFSPMAGLPSIIIPAEKCCLGLEDQPLSFVGHCVYIFREVSRVLKDDGTLWLNLGDSYAGNHGHKESSGSKSKSNKGSLKNNVRVPGPGLKQKDLIGVPWRVAFALQSDGWYLRQDIIWAKPNPMPESVRDRCTKSHEYIFLLSKSQQYYFDNEAIKEKSVGREKFGNSRILNHDDRNDCDRQDMTPTETRNKRSVWTVSTKPYKGAHFATFPPDLIEPCILAGCPPGGVVLDPFGGSGTVGAVAKENDRDFILIELNPEYKPLIDERLSKAHFQHTF